MIEFGTIRGAFHEEVVTVCGCTALVWLCSDLGVCLVLTDPNWQVPTEPDEPCVIGIYPINKMGHWDQTDSQWEGSQFGATFEDWENCQRWLDAFEKRPMMVVLGSNHADQKFNRGRTRKFRQAVLALCSMLAKDNYEPSDARATLKVVRMAEQRTGAYDS